MTPRARRPRRSEWEPRFFGALRNSGNVRAACLAAGVTRSAAYKARATSALFRAAWTEALEDGVDVLEAEARRRAMSGSDQLLMFLLKAHRPGVYREDRARERSEDDTVAEARAGVIDLADAIRARARDR